VRTMGGAHCGMAPHCLGSCDWKEVTLHNYHARRLPCPIPTALPLPDGGGGGGFLVQPMRVFGGLVRGEDEWAEEEEKSGWGGKKADGAVRCGPG